MPKSPPRGQYNNKRLSARHFKVIAALARGLTSAEAAQETGVDVNVLRKWAAQPLFSAALNEALDEVRRGAVTQLKAHTSAAVDYLGRCVAQVALTPVGVKAAEAILDRVGLSPERTAGEAPNDVIPGDRDAILRLLRTLPTKLLREALTPLPEDDVHLLPEFVTGIDET